MKVKTGDIARWVDYTHNPKRVYIGIVLNYDQVTDSIDVICTGGIYRWLAWQCEVINESD